MDNVITNRKGQLVSCAGPAATRAFRLRAMIVALRFREKTGMDLPSVKVLKVAKAETGLRTNKIPVLIAAVEERMALLLDECTIVEAEEVDVKAE